MAILIAARFRERTPLLSPIPIAAERAHGTRAGFPLAEKGKEVPSDGEGQRGSNGESYCAAWRYTPCWKLRMVRPVLTSRLSRVSQMQAANELETVCTGDG